MCEYQDRSGKSQRRARTNETEDRCEYDRNEQIPSILRPYASNFLYNAAGEFRKEYGGPQQKDDGGVKYTHQDIQGSTRTISTQAGFAQARMDYQAFGEQIASSIGQRTTTGYAATDTLRNRYALTERDEATGLDDTWFRKLENRGGRWTSPDPYNGSASIGNGQSWNRYSYVENQPTNFVDPSGLNLAGPGTRYGMLNPMGIAYYIDGMLSDARTVWSMIEGGAFDFIHSNVGGVTFEAWGHEIGPNDGFVRDFVIFHIWSLPGGSSGNETGNESGEASDGPDDPTTNVNCFGKVWTTSVPKTFESTVSMQAGLSLMAGGALLGRHLGGHVRNASTTNAINLTGGVSHTFFGPGGIIGVGAALFTHGAKTWAASSVASLKGISKCLQRIN